MAITGYTFDKGNVTAAADSSLYDFLSFNRSGVIIGRGNNLNVSTSGLSMTVNTGEALIEGRLVEITSEITISVSGSSSGYLVITIDLTQNNTATGTPGVDYIPNINQVRVESVTHVTQQDLHNGGLIYQLNLGSWSSSASSITFTPNSAAYSNNGDLNITNQSSYTGCFQFGNMQICWGRVTITPIANTPTSATVVFPKAFGSIPNVITDPGGSGVPGTIVLGTSSNNPSLTGCDIFITRTNATSTSVNYWAIGQKAN